MKKLSIWLLSILTVVLGFTSCETNEEFDRCPELAFTFSKLDSITNLNKINETSPNDTLVGYYKFTADFPNINETPYEWFVNDSLVDSELILDDRDNMYIGFFGPGTYKICILSETPECPEGISFCKTLVVGESNPACPKLRFITKTDTLASGKVKYKFIADFEGIQEISYEWFVDGELVEDSTPDEVNYLIWDFNEPGDHKVCIKAETPDCPEGTSYCEEITVYSSTFDCPELSFEIEQQGNSNTYMFFPGNFEGVQNIPSEWFVNGDYVGRSEGQQDPFSYEFTPGRYEVCMGIETPECPYGVKKCVEIEIGDPTQQ